MTIRNLVLGIATALVCSLSATAPVRADLEDTLRDMLDANVQVNNPGSISSARRGGFYGGSIYVRGRVMNVSVINFTPPSFSAGCGGIDLFGGSFSMINKEQFVALLRSVAQNAAGYAFHLALKNICEQCSTIIANLQRVIQEMNQFTGNSCQLAKGIVNGGLQALELSDVKGMQTTSMTSGFNDAWDAFWGSLSSTVDQLASTNADGSRDYDKFEVNVVWEAMTTTQPGLGAIDRYCARIVLGFTTAL
jgi:conjugative transfer pilus assembly protein TraH